MQQKLTNSECAREAIDRVDKLVKEVQTTVSIYSLFSIGECLHV